MRVTNKLLTGLIAIVVLSSCATGGFDENPQLDKLDAELAKAPGILMTVDGEEVERNTLSLRDHPVTIGETYTIGVEMTSGKKAELQELEFFRQYYGRAYGQEGPQPVDDSSLDGLVALSGSSSMFEFDYTVPAQDDDGFDFHDDHIITIWARVQNSEGFYSYREIILVLAEPA